MMSFFDEDDWEDTRRGDRPRELFDDIEFDDIEVRDVADIGTYQGGQQ